MLLEQPNWILGYNQIRRDCCPDAFALSAGGTVLMLCNPDADALCAARILSYAFRADAIPYQLRPCGGYARLLYILQHLLPSHKTSVERIQDNESDSLTCSVRAIILLNLGGTKNLNRLLFSPTPIIAEDGTPTGDFKPALLNPNDTKVYVIDSHRPFHLANVHAGRNIVLWNDYNWCLNSSIGDIPSDGDDLSGADEDESSDENESDNSEVETDEPSDGEEAEFSDENSAVSASMNSSGEKRSLTPSSKKRIKRARLSQQPSDVDQDEKQYDDDQTNIDESVSRESPSSPVPVEHELVNEDDTTDLTSLANRISTSSEKKLSIRDQHRSRIQQIRIYYREGSFFSYPISYNVYNLLSRQMRFESVGDLLWLACIGVTDAYIHNRIDLCGYARFASDLKTHVGRIYPDSSGTEALFRRNSNAVYAESLFGKSQSVEGGESHQTRIELSENGRIIALNDELRFFLLRHTCLLEAMQLSSHVCTKLELWKKSGTKRLQEMLAKMGLPLVQCQQPFAFMNPKFKRQLKERIKEHAEVYSLDDLSYTGFVRVTGYKSLISASDISYAVTALLECEPYSKSKLDEADSRGISETSLPFHEDEEDKRLIHSFNIAYDALNSNGGSSSSIHIFGGPYSGGSAGYVEGSDLSTLVNGGDNTCNNGIGAGIRLAINLQRAIINTAVSLVERKAIQRLSHFRYAYLNCTSQGPNGALGPGTTFGPAKSTDTEFFHVFSKPLALTKLAHFLMDLHRCNGKWTGVRASPLILMAENPQAQTYVVVGYEYQDHSDKNKFGQNFVLAAKTMRGTFKFDSFDSNVIEVKSRDVQKFIEQLHFVMEETK